MATYVFQTYNIQFRFNSKGILSSVASVWAATVVRAFVVASAGYIDIGVRAIAEATATAGGG